MKKLLATSFLLAGLTAPLHSANSATGLTDVSVNLPNIIILHYLDSVALTFTATADTAILETDVTGSGALGDLTVAGGLTSGSLTAAGIDGVDLSAVSVTINNAYAVRGLSALGDASVSNAITTADATKGGSTVSLSNPGVSASTITLGGLSRANAVFGNVTFDVDLSSAIESGNHTGAQYTITATGI